MTAAPHWDLLGPADSDADLARAATGGDRSAFAGIYDRYADRLHDFCVGMLRDRDDAADCVQDTFCTAATRLGQLRDVEKLRPWLYAIARNEAHRRLRDRRRETVSDDFPETVSEEPGPDTLAARTELADLVAEAAGGLSDRDRAVLELTYHHGLDGPDLAEALDVTPVNATKMVQRLRDTVERSLGALLLARRIRSTGDGCAKLAALLDGWDGRFTVLMRKRIARHIESCPTCNDDRQRLVSPVALLGAAPVFIPAPEWLRERTLNAVQLTSSSTPLVADVRGGRRRPGPIALGLLAATVIASLGLSLLWMQQQKTVTIVPADVKDFPSTATLTAPPSAPPSMPVSVAPSAAPAPPAPIPQPPSAQPSTPTITSEAPATPAGDPPPVLDVPAPVEPDIRGPAADIPNAAIPPDPRSPAGTANLPPDQTAELPKRRASKPPPDEPPARRAINDPFGGSAPPR
ncbi:RNA polymerase sigma factor [Mycolicibacterium sp. 120270]|uniref:RNA polymerase sigma factor n=1 Tax=Mycolicibacterium sp. 120270 TaxID=3090600 RepID=UPI00299D5E18|nr:sigma-70 family RNA polymerase sigma factor [Mycolicibacterium sp. 120270]MDX1882497.1 sigma-70 family RNA polymerase sigma factor [Mycolicibacterium sp. 120270]